MRRRSRITDNRFLAEKARKCRQRHNNTAGITANTYRAGCVIGLRQHGKSTTRRLAAHGIHQFDPVMGVVRQRGNPAISKVRSTVLGKSHGQGINNLLMQGKHLDPGTLGHVFHAHGYKDRGHTKDNEQQNKSTCWYKNTLQLHWQAAKNRLIHLNMKPNLPNRQRRT